MNDIYESSKIWLTIDVEEITDTNFNIKWNTIPSLDYEKLIDNWINLNDTLNTKSTCFVLGSFAQKYPDLIKKLSNSGHEIASHGNNHNLVYKMTLSDWEESLIDSKKILEDLIGKEVTGYRSASWSLPFEKKYYESLARNGYKYSSSYFPMKTYMYGNKIDKKSPFNVDTEYGRIIEYPLLKNLLPYSGGFYLRVLPLLIEKYLFKNSIKNNFKPIIYIHPYELLNKNLMNYFKTYANINLDFILAFYSTTLPLEKIKSILKSSK